MTLWPYDTLDELCLRVGLRRSAALPLSSGRILPPSGTALWTGQYAYVLLWTVALEDIPSLARVTADAQDWFDSVLLKAEGEAMVSLDGYLVVALASPPTSEVHTLVRDIELSTQVCRKHVIWPHSESAGGWRGLLSVTVLGLPSEISRSIGTDWPELDQESDHLWNRIQELGHQRAAAADIAEATR